MYSVHCASTTGHRILKKQPRFGGFLIVIIVLYILSENFHQMFAKVGGLGGEDKICGKIAKSMYFTPSLIDYSGVEYRLPSVSLI